MAGCLGICFSPLDAAANVAFAKALGQDLSLLAIGASLPNFGAKQIFELEFSPNDPSEAIVNSIWTYIQEFSAIVAPSSIASKDLIGLLAGKLGRPAVTDVIRVVGGNRFQRPILAGSVLATVEVEGSPLLATFRPSSFQPSSVPTLDGSNPAAEVIRIPATPSARTRVLENLQGAQKRPDLAQAKVVVSGGKPLKDANTFELVIGSLADALGGAVGATRAAVDSGIAPNDLQVGQTGKVVAPDLYIAAGISGSTQHVAGIKDSKIIVAINKDKDAPIFEVSDLGLVADLFEAVPELTAIVKR